MVTMDTQIVANSLHEATLKCNKDTGNDYSICGPTTLVYIPIIDHKNYVVVTNLNELSLKYDGYIISYQSSGFSLDPAFTKSLLAIRYVFFSFSILFGFLFVCRLYLLRKEHWVIE